MDSIGVCGLESIEISDDAKIAGPSVTDISAEDQFTIISQGQLWGVQVLLGSRVLRAGDGYVAVAVIVSIAAFDDF